MHLSANLRHNQRGVGLVEVLIAVLVLSFGMLGMVGLQTWSLRNNQSALERGMATLQTNSIVDAMRADLENASNGAYDIDLDDETPVSADVAVDLPPIEQAIADWRQALVASINSTATGAIDCNGADCVITVRWNDTRADMRSEGDQAADSLESMEIRTEVRL
jgi:type IV pilus assembly protein PilV